MTKIIYSIRFILCFLLFTGFIFYTKNLHGNEFEHNPEDTVLSYFHALKNGDVQKLNFLLTKPLLGSKKELFEIDPNYGDFLRNYYQNANMLITDKTLTDDNNICTITTNIFFESGGNPLTIQFYLKNTGQGWKITHEESIP